MTPGLANKIALRFASKIFVTFEEADETFTERKSNIYGISCT